MNNIKHFVSPENTNTLYEKEAISSIGLTREIADKINELIDCYNEFSKSDLEWKQTQEGTIRKGVLYMKDNLVNTIDDILNAIDIENVVERRLGNKVDKNGVAQITLAMLAQEVKLALTGGSVPVVGVDSVGTDNIINRTVSESKVKMSLIPVKMFSTSAEAFHTPLIKISIVDGAFAYELNPDYTYQINLITPSTIYTIKPDEVALMDNNVNSATPHIFYDTTNKVIHIAKPNDRNFDNMLYLGGAYESKDYASCVIPYEYKGVMHDPSGRESGKSVSFLGDSLTSYVGHIPEGYAFHYNGIRSGVSNVNQTWWKRVCSEMGYVVNTNNSYSGSRVTSTKGDGFDGVARSINLDNGTEPDIIFVYMGINDAGSNIALGTYDGKGAVPSETTTFREAYANMLVNIQRKYKKAKVYAMTITPFQIHEDDIDLPEYNKRNLYITDYNECIRELCKVFNVEVIDTECCGLTNYNAALYMGDYDSTTGKFQHPNADGHKLIADCVIKALK